MNEQNQNITVLAVKRWLAQHTNWLLMLDNADDLDVVEEFVPTGGKHFTTLLVMLLGCSIVPTVMTFLAVPGD